MKHLALLASVYALVCALVLPGSILAQDEPAPAATGTAPAEPTPAPEPAEAAPAPADPAPEPAEPAPEAAPPAPEAAAPAPPEPQALADERAEAPDPRPKAIAAASGSVTIADFSFTPGSVTVDQGDTVTWVNNGPTPHSATANGGEFDTGILKAGQSSSHTFDQAGTFSYFCQPHPFMKGTVVVQAAQTGGVTTGGSDTGGSAGTTGSTTTASPADQGPTLPNTGGDSRALLLLGGLLVLLGIGMHWVTSRANGQQEDPRGRGEARP